MFNDYFDDYYNWGLLNLFCLFGIWIVGSILTFVTCSKPKDVYQTKRSSTVHQTQGVVVARTAPESVPESVEIEPEEDDKIRYQTVNDIKNEMSLRHADMEVQIVKSSDRIRLQQYEPLNSQAQTKKPQKQSNQDIAKQFVKQAMAKASQQQSQLTAQTDENKESTPEDQQNQVQKQTPDIPEAAVRRLSRRASVPKQTTRKGSRETCDIKQAGLPEPLRRPSATKQVVKKVSRDTKLGALLEPPRKEPVVKKTASKEINALKQAIALEQQRREMNLKKPNQKEKIVLIVADEVAPEPPRQISPTKKVPTKNGKFVKKVVKLGMQQKEFQLKIQNARQDETQCPPRQEIPEKLSPEIIEPSPPEQQRKLSNFNSNMKEAVFIQNPKETRTKAFNLPQKVLRPPTPDLARAQATQKVYQPKRLPDKGMQRSLYYDPTAKIKDPTKYIK